MIEKLSMREEPYGDWGIRQEAPSIFELMEKINEIIDKLNELEIKTGVIQWFTPQSQADIDTFIEEHKKGAERSY